MPHHHIRALLGLALATTLHAGVGAAQEFTLAVSEGTSDGLNHSAALAKYQPLANSLAQSLGGKVTVVFLREFKALEDGLQHGRFDFIAVRPSNYGARGLRDHGYHYVATTLPESACVVIGAPGSPLKTLADAKGKSWALPEKSSFAAQQCLAELRDQGFNMAREKVKYVREQGAVGFYLQNRLADAGALGSNSSIARQWEKEGHPVLHKGKLSPSFPLIAHRRLGAAQIDAVQKGLMTLHADDAGRTALKAMGIQQFDTSSEKRLLDMQAWLEKQAP